MQRAKSEVSENPNQIARNLISEHGVDKAVGYAMDGVANANAAGDNYLLSIWREVRRLLREQQSS